MARLRDLNLRNMWEETNWKPGWSYDRWAREILAPRLTDSADVDKVGQCVDCTYPFLVKSLVEVNDAPNGTRIVCERCVQYLMPCAHCGSMQRRHTQMPNGERTCHECMEEHWFYCRHHGTYVPIGQAGDHRHGADGCCTSPQLQFSIPYQGSPLPNDTRVAVSLGEGLVDNTGIRKISDFLRLTAQSIGDYNVHDSRANRMWRFAGDLVGQVGREVKTKEGNFPTRMKRAAYKGWKLKIDPEILTEVGNIVARHSGGDQFHIEITRDLNLSAAEFGNTGSCWWTDYKGSRCSLKNNGGFGIRAFSGMKGRRVMGRTWVLPLRRDVDGRLLATFSTKGGVYFVFNGYGSLADTGGVRLVSHLAGGLPYQNVTFNSDRANGMYINGDAGYLVAEDRILRTNRGRLVLELPQHSTLWDNEKEHAA